MPTRSAGTRFFTTLPFFVLAAANGWAQAPNVTAVVNAASYAGAPLAPGSIATAFGSFLLPSPVFAGMIPLPTSLGGLSLQLGNAGKAPLFYASGTQVNFQIPWELAGQNQAAVTASLNGQSGAAQTMSLAAYAPAIFTQNQQGTGQGLIVDPNYRMLDSTNPATPGSTVALIYATGLGPVSNQPASGSPAPTAPLAQTPTTPVVTIGGAPATVMFSGLAPSEIGVYQINALVPAGAAPGFATPVTVSIGGATSNVATMAVNPPSGPNAVPMITGLAPFAANPGGSSMLTINGTGFGPASSVSFNGAAHQPFFASTTQLTVSLSAADLATPGAYTVTVLNLPPGGGVSNTVEFLVQSGIGDGTGTSIGWAGLGRDDRHSSLSSVQSQPLNKVHWSTSVDLDPQFTKGELLIHYAPPLITPKNTVIVPVKTGATSGFRLEAHNGTDGTLEWLLDSDYILPPHDWVPEFGAVLTTASRVYYPGAGGTVYYRDSPDSASGAQGQLAFYGLSTYQANPQAYNSNVMISTPITADSAGNIYFGFQVTGQTPAGLESGIARISASGQGTWIAASTAAGDSGITGVPQNCAPALNESLGLLYIAASNNGGGYLLALNSTTLQPVAKMLLADPVSKLDAAITDDSSATPTVGPDGDVYYGVLENPSGENHYRGWLLHFDARLSKLKTPGSFGWDDTASLVPSFAVPSYAGTSSYLMMTKYNDYFEGGGTGQNKIAVLDPGNTQTDPTTGATVMKEVVTIVGPTPNPEGPGVKEWCINAAAVDPASHVIYANSEDGNLYRWDLGSNTFSQRFNLTSGIGEAYTPTVIGPDGTVYAINDTVLYAVGQ